MLACLSAGAGADASQPLVSIKPLALIYSELRPGQQADVLIPANRNLHDYALTVEDLKKLQQAETLFWLGVENEPFIARLQKRFADHRWVAVAGGDHPWLSPAQLPGLIGKMAEALAQQHPQEATAIGERAVQLQQAIASRFHYWQQQLVAYQHQPFLLGHSAFIAFAEGLGLHGAILYRSGHSHGHSHGGMQELVDIQQRVASGEIYCALEEPDVDFHELTERHPTLQLGFVEPMATQQSAGPGAFLAFIDQTAQAFQACLNKSK